MKRSERHSGRSRILVEAWETWGAEAQNLMLIEELGELIVAVCHWRRNRSDVSILVDEIADVLVMIDAVQVNLDLYDQIDKAMIAKVERLAYRLAVWKSGALAEEG